MRCALPFALRPGAVPHRPGRGLLTTFCGGAGSKQSRSVEVQVRFMGGFHLIMWRGFSRYFLHQLLSARQKAALVLLGGGERAPARPAPASTTFTAFCRRRLRSSNRWPMPGLWAESLEVPTAVIAAPARRRLLPSAPLAADLSSMSTAAGGPRKSSHAGVKVGASSGAVPCRVDHLMPLARARR